MRHSPERGPAEAGPHDESREGRLEAGPHDSNSQRAG
jgi:hypothetical protein